MSNIYTTRWATVILQVDGKLRVNSDGILECRDWSRDELEHAIRTLKEQGWALVGSVDRKVKGSNGRQAMDLFFRLNHNGERK